MDFAFDAEQEELRATARTFLADRAASEALRSAAESQLGYDPALWKQIGAELGWTSVAIPEDYGGLGLGYVELVALLELMGESLVCSPYFATLCLGANALLCAGSEAQKEALLPGIAEGTTTATLAFADVPTGGATPAGWDADAVTTRFARSAEGFVLSGTKSHVLDGATADLLVVAARAEGSKGADGVSLFALPSQTPGVVARPLSTMDQTRRVAELRLDDVRIPDDALLGDAADVGHGVAALEKTLQLAAVGLAAEQVGGAQRCLDSAVTYAQERVQFGRPIGSFQAIKHKCADMMVAVESARSAAYYAGCVAAEGSDAELAEVASIAKSACSEAFFRCAADSLQIHGGVGFTWEYDVHLYFKRARATEAFLGSPAWHRERLAQRILR